MNKGIQKLGKFVLYLHTHILTQIIHNITAYTYRKIYPFYVYRLPYILPTKSYFLRKQEARKCTKIFFMTVSTDVPKAQWFKTKLSKAFIVRFGIFFIIFMNTINFGKASKSKTTAINALRRVSRYVYLNVWSLPDGKVFHLRTLSIAKVTQCR